MVRSELVETIASQNPHLYHKEVEQLVTCIFDEVSDSLQNGHRVELRGFGTFFTSNREARSGRNPKTGETVHVEAKSIPRFRISKMLVERLNGKS